MTGTTGRALNTYSAQAAAGRYFLHEQPRNNSSWETHRVKQMQQIPGAFTIECDQCCFGLKGSDDLGEALIQKPTRWITNLAAIDAAIGFRCQNMKSPECDRHRHCKLLGNRDKEVWRVSERYPPALVAAILRALREELVHRRVLHAFDAGDHCGQPDELQCWPEL